MTVGATPAECVGREGEQLGELDGVDTIEGERSCVADADRHGPQASFAGAHGRAPLPHLAVGRAGPDDGLLATPVALALDHQLEGRALQAVDADWEAGWTPGRTPLLPRHTSGLQTSGSTF